MPDLRFSQGETPKANALLASLSRTTLMMKIHLPRRLTPDARRPTPYFLDSQ
jgi:hypothetical protein